MTPRVRSIGVSLSLEFLRQGGGSVSNGLVGNVLDGVVPQLKAVEDERDDLRWHSARQPWAGKGVHAVAGADPRNPRNPAGLV